MRPRVVEGDRLRFTQPATGVASGAAADDRDTFGHDPPPKAWLTVSNIMPHMETNEVGFCAKHVEMMYGNQNRLGLGLMLHTHMQNLIKETEKAQKKGRSSGGGFFKKNTEGSAVSAYMRQVKNSCYICNRIENIFERYIDTIFYLYEKDSAFKTKFDASKGFCVDHYQILYDAAESHMHRPPPYQWQWTEPT